MIYSYFLIIFYTQISVYACHSYKRAFAQIIPFIFCDHGYKDKSELIFVEVTFW